MTVSTASLFGTGAAKNAGVASIVGGTSAETSSSAALNGGGACRNGGTAATASMNKGAAPMHGSSEIVHGGNCSQK
eukprot:1169904-Rhodomonas_salina.1